MYIHLEAEQIGLHMEVDECYVWNDAVKITVYGFICITIFINHIRYLTAYENSKRVLLIKGGRIIEIGG